ncbi:unnamed protein product [Periconia digitata]|uniref:Uncharacterized protein n=1 Tax=Periconia digitata TaxID=1303443 RepID=A0A9W4XIT2_9PLEO|nr:unnamed protein product [Periconia digitata]
MSINDDLPWNTTRCNRLLRPLSSKLRKLRKELERPRSSNGDRRTSANAFALKASPRKALLFSQSSSTTYKPHVFEKRKDPDWMPVAGSSGATRKTYGARGAKKTNIARRGGENGRNSRPGELSFTPLITRVVRGVEDSPQAEPSPARKHSKIKGPLNAKLEQIQELKKRLPINIGNLVNGLSEAYANLLMATEMEGEKRWKGTRSLFSSCLRKIPDYIELEEHFAELDKEEDDDDEDRDHAHETFTYLEEQFESVSGQGWRAFKQVVRAHGTSLVCDAVTDQMLNLETLQILVTHCLNSSAWNEAEQLLWSYLPNLNTIPMPNTLSANLFSDDKLYFWMCKNFVGRTGRHRFLYDLMTYMISQELLPLEWLATECMRPVWDRLVRTLSDGDSRSVDNAFRLLEVVVSAGVGLGDDNQVDRELENLPRQFKLSTRHEFRKALDTTYLSIFTIFCSIALVNQNRDEGAGDAISRRVIWVLDSLVVGLLKRSDFHRDMNLLSSVMNYTQTFAERAIWAVFSSFLMHLEDRQINSSLVMLDIPVIAKAMCWIVSQYASYSVDISSALSTLPEFTSSTARATGKIWKDDGFDQIQRTVHRMLSISGIRLPHKLWTFKRLALESALEFAHSTSDGRHMAYALKIENTMRTKGHVVISQSPQKDDSPTSRGGFRWEEGIGEWVVCTPFAKQDIKPVPRKPIRSLELLPSPDWSQDNDTDPEGLPIATGNQEIMYDEDEDFTFPQSSPVNRRCDVSAPSLGKRKRATSPVVLISSKRSMLTPPDSPCTFYPELPDSASEDDNGVRRSRRIRTEARTSTTEPAKSHSRRSRTSLEKGLRVQERKSYKEVHDLDAVLDGRCSTRVRKRSAPYPSSYIDLGLCTSTLLAVRTGRKIIKVPEVDSDEESDGANSRPSSKVQRRRSGRKSQTPREWWRVEDATPEGESEDELSFQ